MALNKDKMIGNQEIINTLYGKDIPKLIEAILLSMDKSQLKEIVGIVMELEKVLKK
jgi:hypothetical protein